MGGLFEEIRQQISISKFFLKPESEKKNDDWTTNNKNEMMKKTHRKGEEEEEKQKFANDFRIKDFMFFFASRKKKVGSETIVNHMIPIV